ncbi:MAG: hypothetical protein IIA85_02545 [Nanoarchaeota archaeon]|nr:hypothetical protein [Nanoarchaeota archaeon]
MGRLEHSEQYEERSTIRFPFALDHESSRSLLSHIKNKGNYHSIRSHIETSEIFEGSKFEEQQFKRSGEITILEHPFLVHFNFFRDLGEENWNMYNGIKFSSVGKKPYEIPETELEVWDQVREYTEAYFSQREFERVALHT